MIQELANVVAINDKYIKVTSQIKSSCSGCGQVDTCGSGQLAKALPQAKLSLNLLHEDNDSIDPIKVGDCVVLALPEKHMLTSAAQVYLWPLAGLILFSAIGQLLYQQEILSHELFALTVGLLGGYLGFRLARKQQKQGLRRKNLQPRILKVVPSVLSETVTGRK